MLESLFSDSRIQFEMRSIPTHEIAGGNFGPRVSGMMRAKLLFIVYFASFGLSSSLLRIR